MLLPHMMAPKRFRKRSVVILALRYTGANRPAVVKFAGYKVRAAGDDLVIDTLENVEGNPYQVEHVVSVGDWIIKGMKGEFYSCKPDIFTMIYESVCP